MAGKHVVGFHFPVFEPIPPFLPLEYIEKDIFDNDIGSLEQKGLLQFSLRYENLIPGG